MASRTHRILRVLWLALSIAPVLVSGLKLVINPDPTDPPLIPGNTIHVQSTTEQGDPAKVNLYIYDTVQKNSTLLWDGLEPANSTHSLFEIPPLPPGKQYVVRATQTSGIFLADSPTFEILAGMPISSAPGVSSASNGSTRSNSPTSSPYPSITSAPASTGSSRHSPVGAIVGGVLGGLVLIAIIFGLLVWLSRRRQQNKLDTAANLEKPWAENRNSRLEPFTAIRPPALSIPSIKSSLPSNPHMTAPLSTEGTPITSDSEPASSTLLSSTLPPSSLIASDPKSARSAAGSKLERQKRQITQQLALAQSASSVSGLSESGSSPRNDDADVRQQLNDLRGQIRQLELRQAQNSVPTWHEDTPEEPPPGYNR